MRKKIIAANWKMNGRLVSISSLLDEIKQHLNNNTSTECIIFPPTLYIPLIKASLANTSLSWGAQNAYPEDSGAFTGEVSVSMLTDYNCRYVLVGHSERRTLFQEQEKFIADKFHQVKEHDMIPVLCIGETLAERENNQTVSVLSRQLKAICNVDKNAFERCIIAYEPVWAIGTGKTANPDDVQAVHLVIRTLINEFSQTDANNVSILYGGSVNEKNASALFAMPDVDGGLIGGASLNAQQFVEIVKCIN